jgi:hypothetical protein
MDLPRVSAVRLDARVPHPPQATQHHSIVGPIGMKSAKPKVGALARHGIFAGRAAPAGREVQSRTNSNHWWSDGPEHHSRNRMIPRPNAYSPFSSKTAKSWYPSRNRVMRSRSVLAVMAASPNPHTSLGSKGLSGWPRHMALDHMLARRNAPELLLDSRNGMRGELGLRRTVAYVSRLRPQPPWLWPCTAGVTNGGRPSCAKLRLKAEG